MSYKYFVTRQGRKEVELKGVTTLVEACELAFEKDFDNIEIWTEDEYWFYMWQDPDDPRVWEGEDEKGNKIIIKLRRGLLR